MNRRNNTPALAAVVAAALTALAGFAASEQDIKDAAPLGGLVVKPAKGYVGFIDYQKRVAKADILALSLPKNGFFKLDFRHRPADGAFDIAKASAAKGDANVAIFLVDDPALPMSLIALEEHWGLVNVAALAKDNPKTLKLLGRVNKLVTRVGTVLLGGAHAVNVPFSAMQPVGSLADLDRLAGSAFSAPALSQINFTLPKLGLEPSSEMTYEQACLQGWAPQPKTKIQKEIWDEVHAAPTKPLKIKFDQKKDK